VTEQTSTNPPATPEAGTPEYDQAMAARFDAAQTNAGAPAPAPKTEERPAWLPEKFKSPEDMASAYKELETKLSQGKQSEAKPELTIKEATQEEAKVEAAKAGVDYGAFEQEFQTNGSLSVESYQKLEAAGISRDMVDAYIQGQVALASQIQTEVFSTVGGPENYSQMTTWAATNLTKGELAAYNKAMDYGSVDEIKLAVQGLQARYTKANGSEPTLLGGSTSTTSGDVFRSTQELTRAMANPLYKTDPAYREDVIAKLSRSNIM